MRISITAAAAAALLFGAVAPAQAVVFTIDLSATILTQSPDGDDLWRWSVFTPPLATPANGVLDVTVTFDDGFLRLSDGDAPPDAAQGAYRNSLLVRRDDQQAALAALQAEIGQIGSQIGAKQAARVAKLASLQQTEADLVSVDLEITGIQQAIDDEEVIQADLSAQKAAKEAERNGILGQIESLLAELGGLINSAVEALQSQAQALLTEITQLTEQLSASNQKIIQATASKQTKETQKGQLTSFTVVLSNEISILEGEIADLELQRAEAEGKLPLLTTLLAVTEQEIAQLPSDEDAERLQVVVFGDSQFPVPLFGQLLLDVVQGDPLNIAPFFQAEFSNAVQLNAYADMTGSFIDIRGFTLLLDLYGMPGDTLAIDFLQFTLLAEDIEKILLTANPEPVPPTADPEPVPPTAVTEPATFTILAAGLAGLGWCRTRQRPGEARSKGQARGADRVRMEGRRKRPGPARGGRTCRPPRSRGAYCDR